MKKLLLILSASIFTTSAPITYVYATSFSNGNIVDPTVAANTSQVVAKSLIENKIHNYKENQILYYQELTDINANNSSSIASGLNHTFGTHNPENISGMVSSSSEIGYNINGNSITPDSVTQIQLILNSIQNAKNLNSSTLMNLAYIANVPKLIGAQLENILGKNNIFTKLFQSIPLSSIVNSMNNFDSEFNNLQYASYDDESNGDENVILKFFPSAFQKIYSGLNPIINKVMQKQKLSSQDYDLLANFAVLTINYISQFNFQTNKNTVDNHLFSTNLTNQDYHYNLDYSEIKPINFNNIANLMNNLINYQTNNGLGFAQLLNILFGSGHSIAVSDAYKNVNLLNYQMTPEIRYYNPFITMVENYFESNSSTYWNDILSNNFMGDKKSQVVNIFSQSHFFSQSLALIGAFINDLSSNWKIDNELNIIYGVLGDIKSILTTYKMNMPDNFMNLFNDIYSLIIRIKRDNNLTSLNDTFNPNPIETSESVYDIPMINEQGDSWSYFWNGNISWYSSFSNILNQITGLLNVKLHFSNYFNGIKGIIDNWMNTTISANSDLTYQEILEQIDDQNGAIQSILKNLDAVYECLHQLLNSLTNSDLISKAKDWISLNVDPTKDSSNKISQLINAKNYNLSISFTILSIASTMNAFKNNATASDANNELFYLLGYNPKTHNVISDNNGNPINNTVYGVIKNNWTLIMKLLVAFSNSLDNVVNNLFDQKLKDYLYNYSVPQNITKDNKTQNITYELINNTNKITYEVTLLKDKNDQFYQMTLKQI